MGLESEGPSDRMIYLAMGQRWIGSDALDWPIPVRRCWPIGVTERHKSDRPVKPADAESAR